MFQKPIHSHALLLLLLLASGAETFHICAFNAQRLTLAKVAREPVLDTLVKVSLSLQGSRTPEDHDPKPLALSDQGHVPEKRGTSGDMVWQCGTAPSFPVIGISLLLCEMGAVLMAVAFHLFPGLF